jgi:hypothetical protein
MQSQTRRGIINIKVIIKPHAYFSGIPNCSRRKSYAAVACRFLYPPPKPIPLGRVADSEEKGTLQTNSTEIFSLGAVQDHRVGFLK